MARLTWEPARERFLELLTQIVSDAHAVDVPTRYAALIQCLISVPTTVQVNDHSDLHGAIAALAQHEPYKHVTLQLAGLLAGNPADTSRAPEVMRAWLDAYLETMGWEQNTPLVDHSRGAAYGPSDVEAQSSSHENAALPTSGCCVPLYSESTRFG